MTNEKNAICAFILAMLATSCATTRKPTSNAIIEHQRKIDELEATIARIDSIMSDTASGLREITDRSAGMENEIDAIIREFDEYQQRINRFLSEYNAIRNGIKTENKNNNGANIANSDTAFD